MDLEFALNDASFVPSTIASELHAEFARGFQSIFSQDHIVSILNIDSFFMQDSDGVSYFDHIITHLPRDDKEQLLYALGRCPLGWSSDSSWPGHNDIEATVYGLKSAGAAMAVHRGAGLAGIATSDELRSRKLAVQVSELDKEADRIKERSVDLEHWHDPSTASDFHLRIIGQLRGQIRSARELWRLKSVVFPRLRFINQCQNQLSGLEHEAFIQVINRLTELNEAATEWPDTAPSPTWGSRVTPEYENRRRLCYFTDNEGETHLYDLHARYTPGAGRIHIRLLRRERMMGLLHE